jgi:hypothetical protein
MAGPVPTLLSLNLTFIREKYFFKIQNSIYDLNIWFYDDVAPEYAFSFNEIHVHDHFGVLKEWFY